MFVIHNNDIFTSLYINVHYTRVEQERVYADTMSSAILHFIFFCISFLKTQKEIFKGHDGATDEIWI